MRAKERAPRKTGVSNARIGQRKRVQSKRSSQRPASYIRTHGHLSLLFLFGSMDIFVHTSLRCLITTDRRRAICCHETGALRITNHSPLALCKMCFPSLRLLRRYSRRSARMIPISSKAVLQPAVTQPCTRVSTRQSRGVGWSYGGGGWGDGVRLAQKSTERYWNSAPRRDCPGHAFAAEDDRTTASFVTASCPVLSNQLLFDLRVCSADFTSLPFTHRNRKVVPTLNGSHAQYTPKLGKLNEMVRLPFPCNNNGKKKGKTRRRQEVRKMSKKST